MTRRHQTRRQPKQCGKEGGMGTLEAAAATHCPRGHAYSGENLIIKQSGTRGCRACRAIYRRQKVKL